MESLGLFLPDLFPLLQLFFLFAQMDYILVILITPAWPRRTWYVDVEIFWQMHGGPSSPLLCVGSL